MRPPRALHARCSAACRPAPPGALERAGPAHAQEGNAPPPLSPVVGNGAALLEAAMKPATPDAAGPRSTASMAGGASEPASRAPSESLEGDAADKSKEAKRKGRFQARGCLLRQRSSGPGRLLISGAGPFWWVGQQSSAAGLARGPGRNRMTRRCAVDARPACSQAARLLRRETRADGRRPGRGAGLSPTRQRARKRARAVRPAASARDRGGRGARRSWRTTLGTARHAWAAALARPTWATVGRAARPAAARAAGRARRRPRCCPRSRRSPAAWARSTTS